MIRLFLRNCHVLFVIKWPGYQIMELKAAGWIGIKQMIWGAGHHILDKETRCALVRFIDIMEQRRHIEWKELLEIYIILLENMWWNLLEFRAKESGIFEKLFIFSRWWFGFWWFLKILSRQWFCLGRSNWWGFSLELCWIVWRVSWWRRNASQIPNTFWVARR